MDIRQLQVLRELGELGSVKAVAETLMVTPSAVSQQLALLQRSAGVPLTQKDGRNLVLTNAGRVLADAGGGVLLAMAQARAAIDTYQEAPDAAVTLSGFHSAGQALFAPLARALSGPGQPRVQFTDEDVAQQDFPALTARYDLVLAHRMEHSPPWPDGRIAAIPLASEPLDVAVPAGHPLARKTTLTVEDVASEPWVTSRPGYSPDDVLRAVAAVASRPLDIIHRVNDYTTVASLVATGGVLGFLPRFTSSPVLDSPDRAGVVLRPLGGINTRRTIDVLARAENLERRSVRTVCDALAMVMRGLGG